MRVNIDFDLDTNRELTDYEKEVLKVTIGLKLKIDMCSRFEKIFEEEDLKIDIPDDINVDFRR